MISDAGVDDKGLIIHRELFFEVTSEGNSLQRSAVVNLLSNSIGEGPFLGESRLEYSRPRSRIVSIRLSCPILATTRPPTWLLISRILSR